MKRLVRLLLLFCMAMWSPWLSGEEQDDTLVVLTSADNPPYEFVRQGEFAGFDIDLAHEGADKMNRRLVIRDMPFSFVIPSLMSKRGDMAIAAITPTDIKRESVDFSIPYQENSSAIVLADKDEFINMLDSEASFPIDLLKGKTVCVQLGTHHDSDMVAADIPNLTIRRCDSIGTMIAELTKTANGKGDVYAMVIGTSEAKSIALRHPKFCSFSLKFSDSFAIAFPKNSVIRKQINGIIQDLKDNGRLKELEIKWGISE